MSILIGLFSPFGTMTKRESVLCTTTSFIIGLAFLIYFFLPSFGASATGNMGKLPRQSSLGYSMTSFMLLCGWMRYCILAKRARAEGIAQGEVWKHMVSFLVSGLTNNSSSNANEKRFMDIAYGNKKGVFAHFREAFVGESDRHNADLTESLNDVDLVRRSAELKREPVAVQRRNTPAQQNADRQLTVQRMRRLPEHNSRGRGFGFGQRSRAQ